MHILSDEKKRKLSYISDLIQKCAWNMKDEVDIILQQI